MRDRIILISELKTPLRQTITPLQPNKIAGSDLWAYPKLSWRNKTLIVLQKQHSQQN